MRRFLPIVLGLLLLGAVASAQDTRRQESRKAQLEKEIAAINRQLKDNARSSSRALTDLALVRRKIAARQELIAESDREIRALDDSMKVRQQEIDRLQARHDTLSLYYNRLVRGAYKNRDSRLWYMYILSSENIGQAVRRFGYLRGLSRNMSEQASRPPLRLPEGPVPEHVGAGEADPGDRRRARAREGAPGGAQGGGAGPARPAPGRRGRPPRRGRGVRRPGRPPGEGPPEIPERPQEEEPGSGGPEPRDRRDHPQGHREAQVRRQVHVQGREDHLHRRRRDPLQELRRQQGPPALAGRGHGHPVYKNVKLPFNNGVTLAVARGAQAHAVFDGTVAQVVVIPGYNQCVLVQHGSYFTFYCKLKAVSVKAGEKVKTGQVLGTVDTLSGEDQFHFQLWQERTPQNPENWLR